MESEQGQEYSRLQGEVIVRLRHHGYADGPPALHVFQYLILPSFTPPVAWDVFRRARRGHADEFVLARTSWRSDLDLEKLQTPVERLRHPYPLKPTVELHLLPAPSAELEGLARGLALLSLPIGASPGVFGIDGTTYEVAVEQPPHDSPFAARCRLSWWEETPPGWEGLREWIVRAERVFETAWSMRGDAAATPPTLEPIDDAAARRRARSLFHQGLYAQAAALLNEVSAREGLTPAETKMLELARKRALETEGPG